MGLKTIEQRIVAGGDFNGIAPSGAIERSITPNGADNVTAGTKTWIFANGGFSASDVGKYMIVTNAVTPGNNGVWTIASFVGATTITTVESPAGDETFSGADVTGDIYPTAGTSSSGKDLIEFVATAVGGLFDFSVKNPSMIQSIELKLSGQSAWSFSKRDKDGVELLLWSGTTETDFVTLDADAIVITENQLLVVSTTGATGVLKARISIDVEPKNF